MAMLNNQRVNAFDGKYWGLTEFTRISWELMKNQ